MTTYTSTTDSKAAFSGNSKLLTNNGHITLNTHCGKLVRGYNGGDWSYTHILKCRETQPLVRVTLSDGRSVDCSLDTHFFIDDNFNSMSLDDILSHYRQTLEKRPEIYTNKNSTHHAYEFQKLITYDPIENEAIHSTYHITTIDSAHRAFINNILLRCW